jgi:hypothetical protein
MNDIFFYCHIFLTRIMLWLTFDFRVADKWLTFLGVSVNNLQYVLFPALKQ